MNQANASLFFASPQRDGSNRAVLYQFVEIRPRAALNSLPGLGRADPFGIVENVFVGVVHSSFMLSNTARCLISQRGTAQEQ